MKGIFMALALMASAAPAFAGTNYPAIADYPAPNCIKPGEKPELPPNVPRSVQAGNLTINSGGRDLRAYNNSVAEYNIALNDYTTCMNAYVANAQTDIDMIRDKVNKAVAAGKVD